MYGFSRSAILSLRLNELFFFFFFLQILESTDLIPLSGDIAKITRRAEEFRDLHPALQKNLQTYLTLTMDALQGVHQRVKSSMVADANKQMVRLFLSFSVSFVVLMWMCCRRWRVSGRNRAR
jgi:hypothetical protein